MTSATAHHHTLRTAPAHFFVSGGPVNFRRAGPRPQPLFDAAEATRHLKALGLDPKRVHMRAIQPGFGAQKLPPQRGRPAEIERLQGHGFNIYLVVNPGGATDSSITSCVALGVEWDDQTKPWQINAWRELGLPEPTLQIDTGGKSVHTFWGLSKRITPKRWKPLIKRLIAFCGSDPTCCNPSRVWRLAGSTYWAKATPNTALGQARIVHQSANTYTAEQFEALLPDLPSPSPAAAPGPRQEPSAAGANGYRIRSMAEVLDALQFVRPRIPGNGTYPQNRNTLWGLIAAVEEAGGTQEEAINLMAEHSPAWPPSEIQQVARSGGCAVGSASFWYYAREGGWRPAGGEEQPDPTEAFNAEGDGPADAAGAPPPGQAKAKKSPTRQDVAARLRNALADGINETELELLIQGLSKASGLHPLAVRNIAKTLEAEATRQDDFADSVAAEAEQLQARAAHRKAGAAITLAHLFPAPIADALELRTRYLPADHCAVAVLYLPSIASLQKIGSRITGIPASGFTVPLNIWGGVVAKSGQKKSPLMRRVVEEPTAEVRRELAEGNARERQQWKDACKLCGKDDTKPDEPRALHLHVGDVTGEGLAAELVNCAERKRGLLVLRDELAGLFAGLNQYKGGKGGDGQFLLELSDGGSHTSLRVSGNREFSDSLVSITGNIQPAVLAGLVNDSTGDPDGRYARFLFAPLTEPPKPLPVVMDPAEQDAIDRAGQYLQQIADEIHRAPPRHLHLDPEAMEMFARYEHQQALAANAAKIGAQGAVLGKSAGKVLRVTGLLHLLDQIASGGIETLVGAGPLLRAIDLVECLNQWVLSLHAELATGGADAGLMRKLHETAKAVGEPLGWRGFKDRLGRRQKTEWDHEGFVTAAKALVGLGVGRLELGQKGAVTYVATGELP